MSETEKPLDDAALSKLIEHLQSEEETSLEATLESIASFEAWIVSQPAMRQMFVVDNMSDVLPAVWQFLRAMYGLDGAEDSDASPTGEDKQQ